MPGKATIRPMTGNDLIEVGRLQDICYAAALRDSAAALRSRIDLPGHDCMVATINGEVIGYILAHPWASSAPPLPDTVLVYPDPDRPILYIHDLSVDPRRRIAGIGRALVEASQAAAWGQGITRSELIAIEGAGPYWRRLGYDDMPTDEALTRKVRSYGETAAYLGRDLGEKT